MWSSCGGGTLFAQSTSLRCDVGYCNTAVLVATPGATSGESYLGCWATDLGEAPFTIVKEVSTTGSVPGSSASGSGNVASNTESSSTRSTAPPSGSGSSSGSGSAASSGTPTQSSTGSAQSSGAAAANIAKPLTGVFGLVAMFFGVL